MRLMRTKVLEIADTKNGHKVHITEVYDANDDEEYYSVELQDNTGKLLSCGTFFDLKPAEEQLKKWVDENGGCCEHGS